MTTSNKMNIPETISVGYQERKDTYTGKLAYVIYTDAKGVLRKEKSWDSWRDKKIKATQHTNEPISGFVLNKGVGGSRESYGWNARNEYIRVYDPRGFEFEILGVPFIPVTWNGDSLEDWFHDLKLRASMITWDLEKKKLNTLETKLSDLRSEDAKTEDALTGIMQELN